MVTPLSPGAPEFDVERGCDEPALIVDVEGFEGPLDLLLALAREQKVDVAKISILALADQYLAFVERARQLRLELAADYLVMAAWLAFLKSRLLLPEGENASDPSAEEMATALAFRLKRLEAIRTAAERLAAMPRLDREVFRRGAPEPVVTTKRPQWSATLYDLLSAYAAQRQKHALGRVRVLPRQIWSLVEARAALERLLGMSQDWNRLDEYLTAYVTETGLRASVYASSLAATLEMAREGLVEIHQHKAFAPIFLRNRIGDANGAAGNGGASEANETTGEQEG